MISFKQFLSESGDVESGGYATFDLDKFKHDCAPYLDELKGSKGKLLMYRGSHDNVRLWGIKTWKARTKPDSTPLVIHNHLNEFFTDKFGEPIRNWVFATGWKGTAQLYGSASFIVFPIGKFEWVCGENKETADITRFYWDTLDDTPINNKTDPSGDQRVESAWARMLAKLKHFKWNHNTNLKECIESKNEIMFKCEKYYIFNVNGLVYDEIVKPFMKTI